MITDVEDIYNFVNGVNYLDLFSINLFYEKIADYVNKNFEDVYIGDSYYQDWLETLHFIEDVIDNYENTVELYFEDCV